MKIKANGITINYEIDGKGKDLVLIHGLGDNLNMWYHQLPVFSKSYRVIRYDVRGSGTTGIPENDYSMATLGVDAYKLLKALGVKECYALGYSMGGRIALELAVNHPEMVKALIMANSSAGVFSRSPQNMERRRVMQELLDKGDITAAAEKMTLGAFSPGYRDREPEAFERYMKVKALNNPLGISRLTRGLTAPYPAPDLRQLKCPVLIIAGEKDINMSAEQHAKEQAAIPESKLVVLPTGHASAVEAPERFNAAVLEFLNKT